MIKILMRLAVIVTVVVIVGCGKDDSANVEVVPPPVVEKPDAADPVISRFWFEARYNSGLVTNVTCHINSYSKEITSTIKGYTTMLKGSCTFIPSFTVAENQKVYIGSRQQESGVTRVDFSTPVTYRVVNENGDEATYNVKLSFSFTGLPVVSVTTSGGVSIDSKDRWVSATIAIDGEEYDDLTDKKIEICGRGNSTWGYPKKPYKFKFEERTEILGMPKHKRWVLLANYIDRTMLRNDVAFYLGQQTSMAWNPHGVFVELILNNKHVGNYYLCEQIRIDKNRIPINEMKPWKDIAAGEDITGGYLLELDLYYDEPNKFKSAVKGLPVNIKSPEPEDIGQPQIDYIRDYFNTAERVLYGNDWLDEQKGYKNYIDVESFADLYLVSELIYHYEWQHPKSTYMYKDRGGKLCIGPMWDYDWACFTVEKGWYCRNYLWYPRLLDDPAFKALVKKRWTELYSRFTGGVNYISRMGSKLSTSAGKNWTMWTNSNGPNDDKSLPYADAVSLMQSRFRARLEWLNGEISKW